VNALDRLARNGTVSPENDSTAWATDAAQLFDESKDIGCVSVSFIDSSLKTGFVYPLLGNEAALGVDQGLDPPRRDALEAARSNNAPEVLLSATVNGKKASGFAS